jgi:hypothetical protein
VLIRLSAQEKQARTLLINVAKGVIKDTCSPRLIGYKEFWERISNEKLGKGKREEIVRIITKISAYELQRNRPTLNELVVRVSGHNKREPGHEWEGIRDYLHTKFKVPRPAYTSHADAQRACWEFWGRQATQPAVDQSPRSALFTAMEVEEGELEDRTILFRKRNAKIIQKCKERDNYTCNVCTFWLKIGDNYIIDCHHKYPLGNNETAKITNLDDLMCLCPTCHRIAHSRRPLPLGIEEIRTHIKAKAGS